MNTFLLILVFALSVQGESNTIFCTDLNETNFIHTSTLQLNNFQNNITGTYQIPSPVPTYWQTGPVEVYFSINSFSMQRIIDNQSHGCEINHLVNNSLYITALDFSLTGAARYPYLLLKTLLVFRTYPLLFRSFYYYYYPNQTTITQIPINTLVSGINASDASIDIMHSLVGFKTVNIFSTGGSLKFLNPISLKTASNGTKSFLFNSTAVVNAELLKFHVAIFQHYVLQNRTVYLFKTWKVTPGASLVTATTDLPVWTFMGGVTSLEISYKTNATSFVNSLGPTCGTSGTTKTYIWNPSTLPFFESANQTMNVFAIGIIPCEAYQKIFTCPAGCSDNVTGQLNQNIYTIDCKSCNMFGGSNICPPAMCGDGITSGSQECDVNNYTNSTNGTLDPRSNICNANCKTPTGYSCAIINKFEPRSICTNICGDGIVVPEEQCDDGANNGILHLSFCSSTCTPAQGYTCIFQTNNFTITNCTNICGDGIVVKNQQCDNTTNNGDPVVSYCSSICQQAPQYNCTYLADNYRIASCLPICGDNLVVIGEQCDDGSNNGNITVSYCSSTCQQALGYVCNYLADNFTITNCSTQCGDGIVAGSQQCDNATSNGDPVVSYCSSTCQQALGFTCTYLADNYRIASCLPICGDNLVVVSEQCDDGSNNGNPVVSYCSSICQQAPQYNCTYLADNYRIASCLPICGDNLVVIGEQCDDGPNNGNITVSYCSSTCQQALGFTCTYLADNYRIASCLPICGDNMVVIGEQCDDGPNNGNPVVSYCSTTCQKSPGYTCTYLADNFTITNCSTQCGDGIVAGSQKCEPSLSLSCTSNCTWNSICLRDFASLTCTEIPVDITSLTKKSFVKVLDANAVEITLSSATAIFLTRRLLVAVNSNTQFHLPSQIKLSFPYTSATVQFPDPNSLKITANYDQSLNNLNSFSVSVNSQNAQLPSITDNNMALKVYSESNYSMMRTFQRLIPPVIYIFFILLLLVFFFSSKLIAIEMFLLLQFTYGALIMVTKMEVSLQPFNSLWIFNGYNLPLHDGVQIPARVSNIGYRANFFSNFNFDMVIWFIPLIVGLAIFIYKKRHPTKRYKIQPYMWSALKEWQFAFMLFCLQQLVFAFVINIQYSPSMAPGIVIGLILFGMMGFYTYLFYEKKPERNPTKIYFGDFKKYFNKHNQNFYIVFICFRIILSLCTIIASESIVFQSLLLVVCTLWVAILVVKRPYKTENILIPIINSLVMVLFSIFLLYTRYQSNYSEINFATYIPLVVLVVLGLTFVGNFFYGSFQFYQNRVHAKAVKQEEEVVVANINENAKADKIYEAPNEIQFEQQESTFNAIAQDNVDVDVLDQKPGDYSTNMRSKVFPNIESPISPIKRRLQREYTDGSDIFNSSKVKGNKYVLKQDNESNIKLKRVQKIDKTSSEGKEGQWLSSDVVVVAPEDKSNDS